MHPTFTYELPHRSINKRKAGSALAPCFKFLTWFVVTHLLVLHIVIIARGVWIVMKYVGIKLAPSYLFSIDLMTFLLTKHRQHRSRMNLAPPKMRTHATSSLYARNISRISIFVSRLFNEFLKSCESCLLSCFLNGNIFWNFPIWKLLISFRRCNPGWILRRTYRRTPTMVEPGPIKRCVHAIGSSIIFKDASWRHRITAT